METQKIGQERTVIINGDNGNAKDRASKCQSQENCGNGNAKCRTSKDRYYKW